MDISGIRCTVPLWPYPRQEADVRRGHYMRLLQINIGVIFSICLFALAYNKKTYYISKRNYNLRFMVIPPVRLYDFFEWYSPRADKMGGRPVWKRQSYYFNDGYSLKHFVMNINGIIFCLGDKRRYKYTEVRCRMDRRIS